MPRGKVEVDQSRCKACELCIDVCPVNILRLSDKLNARGFHPVEVVDEEKCLGCAMCATICPDVVFKVLRKEERGE